MVCLKDMKKPQTAAQLAGSLDPLSCPRQGHPCKT